MSDKTPADWKGTKGTDSEAIRALRDDHRKHLEFLQAVIARLAGNSFLIKGWSVTVIGLIIGVAIKESAARLAVVALLPIVLFWFLDSYYLHREQLFRKLYEAASASNSTIPVFSMDYKKVEGGKSWFRTAWSITIWPLYATSVLVVVVSVIATSNSVRSWFCSLF